ncbi:MAG: HAD-IIA family hydrolase [Butyrivibrio sp.]|nr:HAD-IIA family hydrolase [Butyrivibrio sp.]
MDRQELLNKTELFVLDMDGTFYLGNRILEGSLDFLKAVEDAGKRYVFFTNNSSQSPEKYIDKLAKMNCHITRDQIMTSGDVMISYLQTYYKGKSVYLLGTEPLIKSFKDAGIDLINDQVKKYKDQKASEIGDPDDDDYLWCERNAYDYMEEGIVTPDIVVVGFDKTLTYESLTRACNYIRNGALFLATHLDINCPVEGGFIPDCGAMCAAITLSTGVNPTYVGKPFAQTADMVERLTGVDKSGITFVGDRLYTDVATGVNNGAMGVLVLSGEATMEDVDKSDVKPDAIFDSIGEMGKLIRQ